MPKRLPVIAAPGRTRDDWFLTPRTPAEVPVLLWGRANRLRNELAAATSRDLAREAAVRFLWSVSAVTRQTSALKVAIAFLETATTPAFTLEASKAFGKVIEAAGTATDDEVGV